MPKPYSNDLRTRVIEAIESGASRREAAERYEISPSAVVIWAQRWKAIGSVGSKPSGGSTWLLEDHTEFLLGLVVEQPDLTLDEVVATMCKQGIVGSRSDRAHDSAPVAQDRSHGGHFRRPRMRKFVAPRRYIRT